MPKVPKLKAQFAVDSKKISWQSAVDSLKQFERKISKTKLQMSNKCQKQNVKKLF
jgi:hypothetical protein